MFLLRNLRAWKRIQQQKCGFSPLAVQAEERKSIEEMGNFNEFRET